MVLDWLFEGIVNWVAKIVTQLMDAVSGLFLNALGTDMVAMEGYFPFVAKAFTVMQYTAWAILFLITVWQIFRSFGGNITEAENPLALLARSVLFALLILFAKPIFLYVLKIATAPYTALLELTMKGEDFTFAGIERVMKNGLVSFISVSSVVGAILIIILMIALGWNYFKLLLEVVERYIVVGVLCYTSPLAYSMGASKNTSQVFKSWCRMVGSQLLMLVMNVWFLRAFNSSVGQFIANGGALSNGQGSIFLWLFCAIAFLKTAQRFDSYLASLGLNAAQTGSGLGMELLVAARLVTGAGGGMRSAGSVFRGSSPVGGGGFGFANKFKGNSYVRDAVVQGGGKMGAGGAIGFIGRAFGGIAARNGATLTGNSISSVANQATRGAGSISGDIADRSLSNYLPHLNGKNLMGTEINGGSISTKSIGADGRETELNFYNASQFEKPEGPHSEVIASDGSKWYQAVSGANAGEFYNAPDDLSAAFPSLDNGTSLRNVGDGVIEASSADGNSLWYNSGYYDEPSSPHMVITTADGVDWYAMQPAAVAPDFESGDGSLAYNQALISNFMPGYEQQITYADASNAGDGKFEVRHEDGSGTMFYDASRYSTPHGNYSTYEDVNGHSWYGIRGSASVQSVPVYENGSPVYDGENVRTVRQASVKYGSSPTKYGAPNARSNTANSAPKRKN